MELSEFIGKPCRSKMAYEFLPKKKVFLDLRTASNELKQAGEIELTSKVLVMVRIEDSMVSVFGSGKVLVRGKRDEQQARLIAEKAVKTLKESIK